MQSLFPFHKIFIFVHHIFALISWLVFFFVDFNLWYILSILEIFRECYICFGHFLLYVLGAFYPFSLSYNENHTIR